ncbi:tyrosine-protein phosphatase YwqE [Arenibacter algicola]|uniref:protein-tyrosine-phosphatase n=1 Tax=Arenibacter algicola TaxID=616991 RepID=A0ABY3ABS7_9FLAO
MFYFFQKKKFLVDSLENFIDIHNHILPGIDDGAQTVEDSINLIKGFSDIGVKKFIATPHIMHNYYANNPETINDSLLLLKNELLKQNMKDISIRAAAEHMIDDNFESILKNDAIMPLVENYLLVEMSYLQASINFDEAISETKKKGYFPILAHPERYLYLHNNYKKHKKYKKQGVLYQLNLLSLSKYYGKEVQEMAFGLLEKDLIDFVGSDVHNIEQLNKLKEVEVTEKLMNILKPLLRMTYLSF